MQEDMAVRLEDQRLSLEAKVSAVEDKGTRLLHCITPVDNQHALTDASRVCSDGRTGRYQGIAHQIGRAIGPGLLQRGKSIGHIGSPETICQ